MQTFLPEYTFWASARALDDRRLGKQRVEVLQLLSVLKKGPFITVNGRTHKTPWYNHPACKMWRNYEYGLIIYGLTVCIEWVSRGHQDSCYSKIYAYIDDFAGCHGVIYPPWYNEKLVLSHRSNLIRKYPKFYFCKWPDTPLNLPYYWPVC